MSQSPTTASPLGEERIAEIEVRVNAATPGPWFGGRDAEAHGKLLPDWGNVFAMVPQHDFPIIVADTCFRGVYTDEEASACRAASGEAYRAGIRDAWNEPAQVQANRLFVQNARTDIPALIASHRALQREVLEWQTIADGPTARRQFPDGSVPGNSEQAAAGWMRLYEAEYDKGRALAQEVERLTKERDADARLASIYREHMVQRQLRAEAAEAKAVALEARVAEMESAGQALADFAWSAVSADCDEARDYLNSLLANLRATLTHPPQPGEGVAAWWATTGTAGKGDGCNRPFWLREDAIAYVQQHGGHVKPLFERSVQPKEMAR
jgi:hypothetical protein